MENRQKFIRWSVATVLAVYFLILVGGIVRSTGSGMGCPDWPRCFGQWVPPTDVSQLPPDYREHYLQLRLEKNARVAKMLTALGFTTAAHRITNDPSIAVEAEFNAVKTWIEYVNRLIGVAIGILIILSVWFAFRVRKIIKGVFPLAVIGLILVLFQGWLGSIVVSANLLPFVVTLHMLLALVLVAVLIYAVALAQSDYQGLGLRPSYAVGTKDYFMGWANVLILWIQLSLGTQVREEIDVLLSSQFHDSRTGIIEALGTVFITHRTLSYLVLVVLAVQFWHYRRQSIGPASLSISILKWQAIIVASSVVTGVAMAWFHLPAWAQPLHLLFGSAAIGFQLLLVLLLHLQNRTSQRLAAASA